MMMKMMQMRMDDEEEDDDDDDALPMRLALAEKVPTPCYACIKSNPFSRFQRLCWCVKAKSNLEGYQEPLPTNKNGLSLCVEGLELRQIANEGSFLGEPSAAPRIMFAKGGTRRRL